jgi:hypothetical protein
MARSWKRLAEFSENENFGSADTTSAAVEAMTKTWRSGMPDAVIEGVREVFLERQTGLFFDQGIEKIEALSSRAAGYGIGRLVLDHAICVLREGLFGEAACMLRRLSVHAANLKENPEMYVWESLSTAEFEAGAAKGFSKITNAQREYAIAGTLHLKHLASLRHSVENKGTINLAVAQLSQSRGLTDVEVRAKLDRLLGQHEAEWERFLVSLGNNSFVANWAAKS